MNTTADWSFECEPSGREGCFFYHEGSHEIPFYWEYGGGEFVIAVRFDQPDKFAQRYPWAVERRREILERIAQALIRRSPGCVAQIDEQRIGVYVRQKTAT